MNRSVPVPLKLWMRCLSVARKDQKISRSLIEGFRDAVLMCFGVLGAREEFMWNVGKVRDVVSSWRKDWGVGKNQ